MIAVCSNYFVATHIQRQTTCKLKRKKKSIFKNNKIATLLYSTFTEFLWFYTMLLFVEMVMLIKIGKTVHLMISFAIDIFEDVRARLRGFIFMFSLQHYVSRSLMIDFILFSLFTLFYFSFLFSFLICYL